jgi:hypothetical protein
VAGKSPTSRKKVKFEHHHHEFIALAVVEPIAELSSFDSDFQ